MYIHHHDLTSRGKARGSVLLIVLVIVSLLAAFAFSTAAQTRDAIKQTRNSGRATKGEFAAESAISYAQRRLLLEEDWSGTGVNPVEFAEDTRFFIEAREIPGDVVGSLYRVEVHGVSHMGHQELAADVERTIGVEEGVDMAFTFLGDDLYMEDSAVVGNSLITDAPYVVDDWVDDGSGGRYVSGGPAGPFDIDLEGSGIAGDLYKYSDTEYNIALNEEQISSHVKMPEFDLDEYLIPGDDRKIYWYTKNLKDVSHPETAVFVMFPGNNLSLSNCDFPGGVVIHAPQGYDLRRGSRNKIILKDGTTIGGGTGGISPNIGLLAPAVEIQYAGNPTSPNGTLLDDDVSGFTFVNSIFQVENYQFRGQLMVVNQMKLFEDSLILFDQAVADDPPAGINFGPPEDGVHLVKVWEDYRP